MFKPFPIPDIERCHFINFIPDQFVKNKIVKLLDFADEIIKAELYKGPSVSFPEIQVNKIRLFYKKDGKNFTTSIDEVNKSRETLFKKIKKP